jgi:hypothetical protein
MRYNKTILNRGEMHTKFWSDILKRNDHAENLSVDGRTVSERVLRKRGGGEGVEWIHLSQDSDQRRDVVNKVLNLRVT